MPKSQLAEIQVIIKKTRCPFPNTLYVFAEFKEVISLPQSQPIAHLRHIIWFFAVHLNINRSARPGEKSSHREATVQPGAKILL